MASVDETPPALTFTTGGALRSTPGMVDPDVAEARAELRKQDDYYANERVKWMLRWFFVLWLGSLIIDLIACFALELGRFELALGVRLLPLPWALLFHIRVMRRPVLSERRVFQGVLIFDVLAMAWLASNAVLTGGMTSIVNTLCVILPMTMIVVPSEVRRSTVAFFLMLVTYVATVLGGTYADPALRHQLGELRAWFTFLFYVFTWIGMATSMLVVSHVLWSLRREVFESKSVGKYRLRRLLGRGGMGEVWAAYHGGLRREVALKLLSVRGASGSVASRRFEREVQAMVRLTHPNTVRVFDFGVEEGGLLYYAMELLDGENLGRIVKREGALPVARARHFLLQAAKALGEAHTHGIVHRDVKPENFVVIDAGGERDFLKVLDFGIAVMREDEESQKLTQTGMVAGTPGTVSPEVIRGEPATPAADVYALGAVAYLMLSGSLPFESDKAASVMLAHLHDTPIAPHVRRGEAFSPAFEAIVLRCLAKDPKERYPDAHALALALAELDDVPVWNPDAHVPKPAASDDGPAVHTREDRTRPLPSIRPAARTPPA